MTPPAGRPPRVCAAVVTYNRGPLLLECLDALLAQSPAVEQIFVVDNASTDGTPELLRDRGLLDEPRVSYERLPQNLGGAGGFSRAIASAREGDHDWIWVMDDDTEPRPGSLAALLEADSASDEQTVALCQAVVNPDRSLQLGARGFLGSRPQPLPAEEYRDGQPLGFATLVGMLVRRSAACATDPPRSEFFIWGDDYEWCLRLRRLGDLRLVPGSEIVHKDAGHGFVTRRGQLVNRFTGWQYGATPYSGFWRNICGIRNYVWTQKHYADQGLVGACGAALQFMVKALLYDERPFSRIPWIIRATVHGRLGIFDNITPQEWTSNRWARFFGRRA